MKASVRIALPTADLLEVPETRIQSSASEIELKLLVSEDEFKAIQHSDLPGFVAGDVRAQHLHSIYFDTDTGDLQRHRIILRIRRGRGGHVLTVKWAGKPGAGTFERGEIEVKTHALVPDPLLLGQEVADEIARVTEGRPLQTYFATDIKRAVRAVHVGASEIEAAFDTGFIVCGEQRMPVREIELELKHGDPADLYTFGLSLSQHYGVRLCNLSKAARGVLLSSGTHSTSVRAASLALADSTVDQAIGTIIGACIGQFVNNWPALDGPDRVECVHQMRVAMRRLRTALALFHRRFPCAEFKRLRSEAKRIASTMGEARNWDVLLTMVSEGPSTVFPSEAGFGGLIAAADVRRQKGYDRVAELLSHVDTTRFVLSAEVFLARRGWRNALSGDTLPRLTEPAIGFAAGCLERLHRQVCKHGKKLIDLPPEERHEVRIALKNLRYAAEFFGSLFDQQSAIRSYTHAAARLQDALGHSNDLAMVHELMAQLDTDGEDAARAVGIIIGWYGRGAPMSDSVLNETWKSFRKAKLFWSEYLTESERPARR
jgi:inorganic triphosphatase YgiF